MEKNDTQQRWLPSGSNKNTNSFGRGRRRGGAMPSTNVRANLPTVDSQPLPQPGRYLSKVPSVEKNDSLYDEAYFPSPSDEFREVANRQQITSACQN